MRKLINHDLIERLAWFLLFKLVQKICTAANRCCVLCDLRRREVWWVVRKKIIAKKTRCPSARPRIQRNRKNAAFLKNQAMNSAVCIWFLMNTAIASKPRSKPTAKSLPESTEDTSESIWSCDRMFFSEDLLADFERFATPIPLFRHRQTFLPGHYQ